MWGDPKGSPLLFWYCLGADPGQQTCASAARTNAVEPDALSQGLASMVPDSTGIAGCELVPVAANRDPRGCLYEIYRQSWTSAFPMVQWNVCVTHAGVVRGAHVHADYEEYYTLPKGRVVIGLTDIRRDSKSFRRSAQFDWTAEDEIAVVIPRGIAHVLLFEEESVLAFGLSHYWRREFDGLGCQWDDPELGLTWGDTRPRRSERDRNSGDFRQMLRQYEELSAKLPA
jgi:dTDP-4-dehydrorhamnose 3,5-epimerase